MSAALRVRVVVADDSQTARALLVAILRSDAEIEVVAEARDGAEAVEVTSRLRPDLVTMDIRMPRMDGLQATKEIMATTPTPIVIVSGSVEPRDVEVSMHALRAGALALLAKPAGPSSPRFADECRHIVETVKAMAAVKVVRLWRQRAPIPARPSSVPRRARIVAMAASTGGPAALQQVLSGLPASYPLPILVVQHIAPDFVEGLAAWLDTTCRLRVKVAEDREAVSPRTVYLAPDRRDLAVSDCGGLSLSAPAPGSLHSPSATHLFTSVARAYGAASVGVVLTGMGQDGLDGLCEIRRAGGRVVAQDEHTSVVFGMPKAAIDAGIVDVVAALPDISSLLLNLTDPADGSHR